MPNENSPNRPPVVNAVPASAGQGLARTPSLRQTRLARKPANRMSSSFTAADVEGGDDDDTKSANSQLIAELKERVLRAEQKSEQYQKQLEVMQQRLEDSAAEQTTAEERDYQRQTDNDRLRAEVKDSTRQYRELEVAYDTDRNNLLQERERQADRVIDLEAKINRLTEALRTRGTDRMIASRSGKLPPPVSRKLLINCSQEI